MNKAATLVVKIVSDAKQAAGGIDGVRSKIGGLAKTAGAAAAGGVVALGAGIGALAVQGVKDAANLEQSIGAIDSVFKKNAGQMHTWAKSAATDVGLTRNEFNELGTLIGAQLKNGGTAMDQLAPKTNQLIGLGADLSSMFGGSTKDAVSALSSALKGERDPIERYGVSLNQAKIDAEAAALGFKKTKDGLSGQATQAATLSLIMKQTADAQGNFAKEGNTLAHQQQVLAASWGDMKTTLGTALLPIVNKVFTFLNTTAVPAVKSLFGAFAGGGGGGLSGIIAKLGLENLWAALQRVGAAIQAAVTTYWPAIKSAIVAALPTFQAAVTAVIGLVTAIADRAAPTITALAPVVTRVFGIVVNIISAAMSVVSAVIRTITAVIRGDWSGAWQGIKDTLAGVWRLIGAIVNGALAQLRGLVKVGLAAVTALFRAAPGAITGALGNLGGLLGGAGRAIMDSLLGGLREKWEKVKGFVSGIAGWIRDNKGPLSYDRRLLRPAGRAIMDGLTRAMRAGIPKLRTVVRQVTREAAGVGVPDFAAPYVRPSSTPGTRRGGAGVTIIINGALDRMGTARQVKELLRDYDTVTGVA